MPQHHFNLQLVSSQHGGSSGHGLIPLCHHHDVISFCYITHLINHRGRKAHPLNSLVICPVSPTLILHNHALNSSDRLASGAGKAPRHPVHQPHHGRPLHPQCLHRLPLLHAQQPHQCRFRQRMCQHGCRENLLHLHHAHGW